MSKTRHRFSFEFTRGSNSVISVVSRPNDLKFWQMIGLTSGLIWYFIKKVGFLLKKRSFCRFTKKRRVKVKWGSNGDTSVVSWTKWPQIENIPNIRTGDDTQRKWTVFFYPQITPKIDCYFKRLSKYVCSSKWGFYW